MRWMPQIVDNENRAIAQIVGNNGVAADIVRKNDVAPAMVGQNCFREQ